MSGGSYAYLYCKDATELAQYIYNLTEMADDLDVSFPGTRAAKDTRQLLEDFNKFMEITDERIQALAGVWQAMEWWHSSDSGRDHPEREIAKYKFEKVQPHMSWVPSNG